MHEVTKEEFKEIYFRYGKVEDGWGPEYWHEFYENPTRPNIKYMVDLPEDAEELRMMIANDYTSNEYRLFFITLEQKQIIF